MPGAGQTVPLAINSAGDIVGLYSITASGPRQGFLLSGGVFTTIDVPGAVSTTLYGVNDLGQIVGFYCIEDCQHTKGFVFDGQTFTDIQYPGATTTVATGINNSGQIVGYAGLADVHAFLLTNGVYTDIKPPLTDNDGVLAFGINDLGDIVGGYYGLASFVVAGWALTQGAYVKIEIPGSQNSSANGINDSGEIVGYDDAGAFILNQGQTKHHELKVPGSIYTFGSGINSLGVVVGSYTVHTQGTYIASHGFMWTP